MKNIYILERQRKNMRQLDLIIRKLNEALERGSKCGPHWQEVAIPLFTLHRDYALWLQDIFSSKFEDIEKFKLFVGLKYKFDNDAEIKQAIENCKTFCGRSLIFRPKIEDPLEKLRELIEEFPQVYRRYVANIVSQYFERISGLDNTTRSHAEIVARPIIRDHILNEGFFKFEPSKDANHQGEVTSQQNSF